MISTTCQVASRLAITGLISVYFFRDTVVRPQVLSGRDKVTAGQIVVSTCVSTVILVLAAHRTAAKFLSGEIGAPSTDETLTDTGCPALRRQDTTSRCPPVNSASLVPVQPPFLPFQPILSSPVLDPTPCNTIMINLSTSSSPVFISTTPYNKTTTMDLPIASTLALDSTTPSDIITTMDLPTASTPVIDSTTPSVITTTMDLPTASTTALDSTKPIDIITTMDLPTASTPVLDSTAPSDITTTMDLPTASTPVIDSTTPSVITTTMDLPTASTTALDSTTPSDIITTMDLPTASTPVLDSTAPSDIATTVDLATTSTPVLDLTTPSDITIFDLPTPLSPVFLSIPSDISIIELPDLANCSRLSFTSDTTVIARDDKDDSKNTFADDTSNTKEAESSGDQRTFHEAEEPEPERAAQSQDNYATTANPIKNPPSRPANLRRLALVDKMKSRNTNPALPGFTDPANTNTSLTGSAHPAIANTSLTGSAHPTIANTYLTGSAHPADANAFLTGSTYPTNALGQKTKAAASWLMPLILVTKYASRLIPPPPTALQYPQPEKPRPHKLKPQKRKHRASRSNAACDSIVRSRLRRHANRIVGHLAQVCEQIRADQAVLMDGWVAAMAELGLTSTLAGNHQTSPGSPLPPIADAVLVLEPGSRTKARIASLRQRTNAIVATISATTTTTIASVQDL